MLRKQLFQRHHPDFGTAFSLKQAAKVAGDFFRVSDRWIQPLRAERSTTGIGRSVEPVDQLLRDVLQRDGCGDDQRVRFWLGGHLHRRRLIFQVRHQLLQSPQQDGTEHLCHAFCLRMLKLEESKLGFCPRRSNIEVLDQSFNTSKRFVGPGDDERLGCLFHRHVDGDTPVAPGHIQHTLGRKFPQ